MGTQEQERQEVRIVTHEDGTDEAVGLEGITEISPEIVEAIKHDIRLFGPVVRHVAANLIQHELEEGGEPTVLLVTAMKAVSRQIDKLRFPEPEEAQDAVQ